MGFKCGIVGLPNVGKSTLFNALTAAGIAAENYPFCTIEPNTGIVPVPDRRLDVLATIVEPEKTVPTTMEFVDIAGLVAGASKGEGLGNQFLAHVRETDAIAHVIRCFENEDIAHVHGRLDPTADIETVHTELALADMETLEKAANRVTRAARAGTKGALAQRTLLEKIMSHIDSGQPLRSMDLDDEQRLTIRDLHLLTIKPTLYIANVDEAGFQDNVYLDRVIGYAKAESAEVVPVCAAMEAEIAQLEEDEKGDFLVEMDLQEPGLNRVIRAGYRLLHLQTFFTAGPKEARAWTIKQGATAPQAAGRIHSDFEKGFIRAEVVSYDDFVMYKGEHGAKEMGRWRLEGKDYIMQEGDVVHFRFNV